MSIIYIYFIGYSILVQLSLNPPLRFGERIPARQYSYTALFFLDTLCCLAPGCRESSGTGDVFVDPYHVSLAPNPVQIGLPVKVKLTEYRGDISYTITDTQGRRIKQGRKVTDSAGTLLVDTSNLDSGVYYIIVWPENGTSAMLTKAVMVR